MVRIILILLALCLCGVAGYAVNLLPQQRVYVFAAGYYVETSLIVWLILSLIASGIIFYCLRILCVLWHSPQILSRSSSVRRRHKAERLLKSGLAAMLSGHYGRAERDLEHGGRLMTALGQDAVIYYENAAIAADRQNAKDRRDHYLLRAREGARQQQSNLTRLTEAEIHVQNGAYEQALKLLEQLHNEEPRNSKIIALLDQTYAGQQAWDKAWSNLSALRRQIDGVDEQLLELLAKRMRISREIGVYKKEHNMPILQSPRYGEILENRAKAGAAMELNPDFVQAILKNIHEESVRQQMIVMNQGENATES